MPTKGGGFPDPFPNGCCILYCMQMGLNDSEIHFYEVTWNFSTLIPAPFRLKGNSTRPLSMNNAKLHFVSKDNTFTDINSENLPFGPFLHKYSKVQIAGNCSTKVLHYIQFPLLLMRSCNNTHIYKTFALKFSPYLRPSHAGCVQVM